LWQKDISGPGSNRRDAESAECRRGKFSLRHSALSASLRLLLLPTTERVITQKQAKINITGGRVYIVEKGTIDTRLVPCNLADEFRVNGLDVIVSGEVKVTPDVAGEPCCVPDIVITEISR